MPNQKPAKTEAKPARRGGGPKRVGLTLPAAAVQAYRKHGFAESRQLTDWQVVVGERLADVCLPEKLSRDGVLSIRVAPAFGLELQHLEPKILERIATFFGHRAVSRLKLRQGEVQRPERRKPRETRALTPGENVKLEDQLSNVDDDDMRTALERLGRAVLGAKPAPSS